MDDMEDSLFEGMVLFNPTPTPQLPVQLPVNDEIKHENDAIESPNHREITSIEPLDENLFSDLTLVQPEIQNDDVFSTDYPPVSPSSSSTSSRSTIDVATSAAFVSPLQNSSRSLSSQISSSRKKKKAGLRIGYGRTVRLDDPAIDVDDLQLQSPSLPVVVSGEKVESVEEKQEKQIVLDSDISSESMIVEATVSEVEEPIQTLKDVPQEEDVTEVESKEDSVELRYDQIKKQIAEKLDYARGAVASVSVKRKEFIRKRRKAAEELNFVSVKQKEMEKELEEAVESEDFETAERVSDSLADAEKNKELLLIALREAEADCDAVDSKMQEALELQIVAEEDCAALLERFAADADRDGDSVILNAQTKTAEEMEKWLSLSEALEVKKMEVEIESHVLSGARQVVDESIEQVVKVDKEESQVLHKRKIILSQELHDLLDLVKQKEIEIAENDLKIEKVEKKMSDAVLSFQEAQSNIHLKSENLQLGLSQLELENDALSLKKKEIDDFLLQEEARGSKIKKLGQESANEVAIYQECVNMRKSLIEFISKSREDKTRLATTEQKLIDDVQILKQDISAVRASLQDLSSTKSVTQQTIESSKQRLLFIEKRVPEIESEKRVAATARNFKEAARIANEAKTLYVEKESLQLKIEEAVAHLKKIEDDINNNVEKLQEKEENISLMEKQLETVRYQRLILVAGAATAERSAAIEFGDLEEADILLKEAQAADSEAKKIQKTFKEEEFENVPKSFISLELVSTSNKMQLAELTASTRIPAP